MESISTTTQTAEWSEQRSNGGTTQTARSRVHSALCESGMREGSGAPVTFACCVGPCSPASAPGSRGHEMESMPSTSMLRTCTACKKGAVSDTRSKHTHTARRRHGDATSRQAGRNTHVDTCGERDLAPELAIFELAHGVQRREPRLLGRRGHRWRCGGARCRARRRARRARGVDRLSEAHGAHVQSRSVAFSLDDEPAVFDAHGELVDLHPWNLKDGGDERGARVVAHVHPGVPTGGACETRWAGYGEPRTHLGMKVPPLRCRIFCRCSWIYARASTRSRFLKRGSSFSSILRDLDMDRREAEEAAADGWRVVYCGDMKKQEREVGVCAGGGARPGDKRGIYTIGGPRTLQRSAAARTSPPTDRLTFFGPLQGLCLPGAN